jgi:hypothetical protein
MDPMNFSCSRQWWRDTKMQKLPSSVASQVKAGPNDSNHTKVSPPCSSISSIISIGNRISEVKCFLNGVFPHEMTTPKFQCRSSLVISSYAHMRAKLDNMSPHKHQQHFMIIAM